MRWWTTRRPPAFLSGLARLTPPASRSALCSTPASTETSTSVSPKQLLPSSSAGWFCVSLDLHASLWVSFDQDCAWRCSREPDLQSRPVLQTSAAASGCQGGVRGLFCNSIRLTSWLPQYCKGQQCTIQFVQNGMLGVRLRAGHGGVQHCAVAPEARGGSGAPGARGHRLGPPLASRLDHHGQLLLPAKSPPPCPPKAP